MRVPIILLAFVCAPLSFSACADTLGSVHGASLSPPEAGAPLEGGASDGGINTMSDGALSPPVPGKVADDWHRQVIYLAMPDRFFNGDASNDATGNPGCFNLTNPKGQHGGDVAGLRQKRGYLTELGVTALWVTPLYKQSPARCSYHGYWADFTDPDDGAIEPPMGSATEVTGLVADLHAANIRFILDMVVNHAGIGARIVTQHPDWFHDPATCAKLGNPDVYCPIGGMPLPDFAEENPVVASYLTAQSTAWESRFGIDGVRMDTAKNVGPTYFQNAWIPAVTKVKSDLFTVAEVFDESGALALKPYVDAGFTSVFNYPLYGALTATFAGAGSVDLVASKIADDIAVIGLPGTLLLTSFLDNHDNPRFPSQVTGVAEDEISRRYRLALTALFTVPGIPQLYFGDELGLYGVVANDDHRRDMPTWAWASADRAGTHPGLALPDAMGTFAFVQKLIQIRQANGALYEGAYVELWRQNGGAANVLAFVRSNGKNRILVAFNNGATDSGALSVPIQKNPALSADDHAALADGATLTDLLGAGAAATLTVTHGNISLDLPAKTAGIYRLD